jgi:hypothetical protein
LLFRLTLIRSLIITRRSQSVLLELGRRKLTACAAAKLFNFLSTPFVCAEQMAATRL